MPGQHSSHSRLQPALDYNPSFFQQQSWFRDFIIYCPGADNRSLAEIMTGYWVS